MSAWGHQLVPLDADDKQWSCNSCRGDWETKPRGLVGLCYCYASGQTERPTYATRRLCLHHAHTAADRYGLHDQLEALRIAGFPDQSADGLKAFHKAISASLEEGFDDADASTG